MIKPTIGIEIELPWRHVLRRVDPEAGELLRSPGGFYALPDVARARVQQGFDAVDERYRDLADSFFGDDIVKKSDGYTEFAFAPKRDHNDITEIASGLYDVGLLQDGEDYPLHVTLGGIAASNKSWLILTAAELSGGVTKERITQVNTWSQKGVAGIRQRGARELGLGATVAIEMRSLEARSVGQLGKVLEVAQTAGAILLSSLRDDYTARDRWSMLYRHTMHCFDQKEIDGRTKWQNPQQSSTKWQQLGGVVADTAWQLGAQQVIKDILLP